VAGGPAACGTSCCRPRGWRSTAMKAPNEVAIRRRGAAAAAPAPSVLPASSA
jgi:hypothetical protein